MTNIPNVNVQTQSTTQRTLELDDEQVQDVLTQWARKEHGFDDVDAIDVFFDVAFDGLFKGVTISETFTTFADDSDTSVGDS